MTFHERVLPPVGLFALAAALGASFGLIVLPLSTPLAATVAAVFAIAAVGGVWALAPIVEVRDGGLRAGTAQIGGEFLASPVTLAGDDLRDAIGTHADARAYLSHRAYAPGAVRVDVVDPRDPTPYWIVSTNRPDELRDALAAIARSSPA